MTPSLRRGGGRRIPPVAPFVVSMLACCLQSSLSNLTLTGRGGGHDVFIGPLHDDDDRVCLQAAAPREAAPLAHRSMEVHPLLVHPLVSHIAVLDEAS